MTRLLDDWLDRIQQRHPSSIELGLERCRRVWKRMGMPRPARRIVTVAGTNGKGSTVAGIEAGLLALGHRVAVYTSPHLLRYNERIRIAGAEASDERIIAGFEAVEAALEDTHLTYFEYGTLAAFAAMATSSPEFAVLEIGLGGRLDAVNLVDADLAVITPIGIDHQEYLGDDRETIGHEKAGIMRPGQTVVCSDRDPPESLYASARKRSVRLIQIGEDFAVSRDESGFDDRHDERIEWGQWRYFFADMSCRLPVAMHGRHQADNLAASLTSVLLLVPESRSRLDDIAAAVAGCRVRGRLEQISESPRVVIDVGHNPLAASVIREYIRTSRTGPCRIVFGMLRDKDAESVVRTLDDEVDQWYCGGLTGSRGQSGQALCSRVQSASASARVAEYGTISQALDAAIRDDGGEGLIVVFGSFQTAGEALMHFERLN